MQGNETIFKHACCLVHAHFSKEGISLLIDHLFVHLLNNPIQPLVSNIFNEEHSDNRKRLVVIAFSTRQKLIFINDGTLVLI